MAAGGVVPTDRTVCAADICDIWPWLKAEDVMNEISDMFCEVVRGTVTIDELVDFVASREPAALEQPLNRPGSEWFVKEVRYDTVASYHSHGHNAQMDEFEGMDFFFCFWMFLCTSTASF